MCNFLNTLYGRTTIVFHAILLVSLSCPTTQVHAWNYHCSIADDMVEKVAKEVLRPLNKLRQKPDLCIKDIARGLVQAKRNADKIHNTGKDSVTIFKEVVKTLKQKHGVSLPANQVKNFAKLLQECERDTKGHWFASVQAKKDHSRHSKEDVDTDENFCVGVGLAVLEGVCGVLIMTLGAFVAQGNPSAGKRIATFGGTIFADAVQKFFREETYEKEPKKDKR